jgi:hypothetical protein
MTQISITRALAQVKSLNDRIQRASNLAFVTTLIGGKHQSGVSVDEATATMQSNLQSVQGLIAQRSALKAAIVKSNAVATVSINGVVTSVAEAIERKGSIQLEQVLLQNLRQQLAQATQTVERTNVQVNQRLDQLIQTTVGKDRKVDEAEVAAIANPFLKSNEAKLLDANGLQVVIDKLQSSIEGFLLEVDYALSEVNATTKIELI